MSKLIVPLGLILASIAVIILFIVPGWQHFLVVRADSKHLDEINAEIDALTKKRDALNDQIAGITKDNFDRLDQIVPSSVHGPEFLVFLEQLAQGRGLSVVKLDLSGTLSTKSKTPEKKVKQPSVIMDTQGIPNMGIPTIPNAPTVPSRNTQANVGGFNANVAGFNAVSGQEKTQTYQTLSATMEVSGSYEAFKNFLHDLESSVRITDVESLDFSPLSGSSGGFSFKLGFKTYYQ